MSRSYVAIDLETTGLELDRDTIIEVGAIRFDAEGTLDTFHSFVNPGRPISYRIQRLTSITDDDVAGAPQFAEIASDLEAFLGDDAIVGQNVTFDLGFLDRGLVRPPGPVYDTQELAGLLLPGLPEQNLRAIARYLDIDFNVRHRALADAEAARQVFLALRQRLAVLPPSLLAEAERMAAATDWPLRHLLRELLEEQPTSAAAEEPGLLYGAVRPPEKYGSVLKTGSEEPRAVDTREIEDMLSVTARGVIDGFEERTEQIAMACAVSESLNEGGQLVVEAGTGVGKSLAYLLPAARYATGNGARIVISTNTINLQGQLMGQDIPMVERLLANRNDQQDELRAAQLKGRRNYLCLLRWANLRRSTSLTSDEEMALLRLLIWLPHSETGDRSELRLSQSEETVWNRLNAQHEACLATACAFVRDGSCFLLRARRRAEAAHLLVVNHALLLADVAVGGGVIPEYQHLIVDEAQHLEEQATDQFGFRAGEDDVNALLDRVASRSGGILSSIRNASRGLSARKAENSELIDLGSRAQEAVERARELSPDFFLRLSGFLRQQGSGGSDYDDRLLLSRSTRVQPDWAEVEIAWENLNAALGEILSTLDLMHAGLQASDAPSLLGHESLVVETADTIQRGKALREGIGDIVLREDPNTVCWLTQQHSGPGASLSSAPLQVAELLEERLFAQKETTVLTSATLTSEGRFDYLRQTVGLPEANELLLGSPFDYATSTMVMVPQDMPEPNQTEYMASLRQALIDLVRASQGRALVLFTAHASLRSAYYGIKRALEEEQILVLGHYIDGSPRQLIQALREQPRTVVLGTASFWEGVDVVGEALSLLVMARLPFAVPDDPIFEARSELFDDPFNEYAVPQAALRFKQGFGRLIRRKTDRGVMVVLDGRIDSKAYGQTFLHSLPPCTLRRVPLGEMPGLLSQWLDDEPKQAEPVDEG